MSNPDPSQPLSINPFNPINLFKHKKTKKAKLHPQVTSGPLPELPNHIWIDIFKLLKRPTFDHLKDATRVEPTPYHGGGLKLGDWKEYHQNDLVSLIRVSKRFHTIITPLLYDRVIVSDPYLILYGITYTPKLENRVSKIQQLSQVRSIILIYAQATASPSTPSLKHLNWSNVDMYERKYTYGPRELTKIYISAVDSTSQAIQLLRNYRYTLPVGAAVFPQIENCTIGISPHFTDQNLRLLGEVHGKNPNRNRHQQQSSRMEDQIVQGILKKKTEIEDFLARELIYTSSPSEICYHSTHGPWTSIPSGLLNHTTVSALRKPRIITMFLDQAILHSGSSLNVVPGTTTFWMISKDLLQAFIPKDGVWHMSMDHKMMIAVPRLFKKFRKIITKSIKLFPSHPKSGQTMTELAIILPINLNSFRLAVQALRPGSQQTYANMNEEMVLSKLEGFLMNKGVPWFKHRGLTIKVRRSKEGVPITTNAKKDPVTCRCCGLVEYI